MLSIEDEYQNAIKFVSKRGYDEDFAGWYILNVLERGNTQPLHFAYIDYLRTKSGRGKNPFYYVEIGNVADPQPNQEDQLIMEDFMRVKEKKLNAREKKILAMVLSGDQKIKIAEEMKVSASRITQVISNIVRKMEGNQKIDIQTVVPSTVIPMACPKPDKSKLNKCVSKSIMGLAELFPQT